MQKQTPALNSRLHHFFVFSFCSHLVFLGGSKRAQPDREDRAIRGNWGLRNLASIMIRSHPHPFSHPRPLAVPFLSCLSLLRDCTLYRTHPSVHPLKYTEEARCLQSKITSLLLCPLPSSSSSIPPQSHGTTTTRNTHTY